MTQCMCSSSARTGEAVCPSFHCERLSKANTFVLDNNNDNDDDNNNKNSNNKQRKKLLSFEFVPRFAN